MKSSFNISLRRKSGSGERPAFLRLSWCGLSAILVLSMLFLAGNKSLLASSDDIRSGFIDKVYSFRPNDTQFTGRDEQYYPENIFGPPFENASESTPASADKDVLSLGREGEIIVGFKAAVIIDGDGPDFVIFENVMKNSATGLIYAEPAKVAVSRNGIDYFEFPYDSLTLDGCAGVTPTHGEQNPFEYDKCGGDAFDLADLGLDYAAYIKITDISRVVTHDPEHPYYYPAAMVLGFDLDAVAGIYLAAPTSGATEKNNQSFFDVHDQSIVFSAGSGMADFTSLTGRNVFSCNVFPGKKVSLENLGEGIYIIRYGKKRAVILKSRGEVYKID